MTDEKKKIHSPNDEEEEFLRWVKYGRDVEKVEEEYSEDYIMRYGDWINVENGRVFLNERGIEYVGEPIQKAKRNEPEFKNVLPDDHFISRLIETNKELTDAYPEYHFGGGLSLLSLSTQRKALANITPEPKYLNLWVLLLGMSTISRKSTAIKLCKAILEMAGKDHALHAEEFSKEQFFSMVSHHPTRGYWNDEFGDFLAMMRKQYQLGLSGFLCRLYDSPKSHRKELRNEEFEIENAFLPMYVATQPETFARHSQEEDIDSGLYPRFLYLFPSRTKERKSIEEIDEEINEKQQKLAMWFEDLYNYFLQRDSELKFGFTEGALELHEDWASKVEKHIQENDNSRRLSIFFGRMQIYAFKLACLFGVGSTEFRESIGSENSSHNSHNKHNKHTSHDSQSNNRVKRRNRVKCVKCVNSGYKITESAMKLAIYYLNKLFLPNSLRVARLIEGYMDENKIEKVFDKLVELGERTEHSKLLRYTHLESDTFKSCINTLKQAERIRVEIDEKERKSGGTIETRYYTALRPDGELELPEIQAPTYEEPFEDDWWESEFEDLEKKQRGFYEVGDNEDLKCCNHSDRDAVMKVEDGMKDDQFIGLCKECFNDRINKTPRKIARKVKEKLEDVGAGPKSSGPGADVQTVFDSLDHDEEKIGSVVEEMVERGDLMENEEGKIKVV